MANSAADDASDYNTEIIKESRSPLHCADVAGYAVSLDFHRRQPGHAAATFSQCGLDARARVLREPDDAGDFPEQSPPRLAAIKRLAEAAHAEAKKKL